MEKKLGVVDVQTLPVVAGFNWSVGFMMERFIKALAKKEFLAARCQACNYTYVPPRWRCGRCHGVIEEKDLVPLSGKGTLMSYTTAYVALDGNGNFVDLPEPVLIGAVRFDGADSTMFLPLEGISPKKVKEGLRVRLQWREQTKGEPADISSVVPASGKG
jgi:uncharacterized OB-fold protein